MEDNTKEVIEEETTDSVDESVADEQVVEDETDEQGTVGNVPPEGCTSCEA